MRKKTVDFSQEFSWKNLESNRVSSTFALCCISIAAEWRAFLLAKVYTGIATFYEMGYC